MAGGPLPLPVRTVSVQCHRRAGTVPRSFIHHIGPEAAGLCPAPAWRQHANGCVVGMENRGGQHLGGDGIADRLQPPGGLANPVAQGGSVDLHPIAGEDASLTVERQAIDILADHHMGDQPRPRPALLDRQIGRGRLHHRFAVPAGKPWADVADDLQPGRDTFQHFGHILTEHRQARRAAAGAGLARMVPHLLARQMRWQGPAHGMAALAPGGRRRPLGSPRRGPLGFAFLQILKTELELGDLPLQLLRGAAELHPSQDRQLRLHLLDEKPGAREFGPGRRQFALALGQRRRQAGDLGSSGIGRRHEEKMTSPHPSLRPASGPMTPIESLCRGSALRLRPRGARSVPPTASRSPPAASTVAQPTAEPSPPSSPAR